VKLAVKEGRSSTLPLRSDDAYPHDAPRQERARQDTGQLAIAIATMHFGPSTDPHFPWAAAAKTRASFTMVKRDGIWKIVHFQNTLIDPKAENDDETKWDTTGFPPPGHPLYMSTAK